MVRSRTIGLVVAAVAMAIVVFVIAVNRGDDPPGPSLRAQTNSDDLVGVTFDHTVNGQAKLLELRVLCTTGTPIAIAKVVPAKPTGGIRVVEWGTSNVNASGVAEPTKGHIPLVSIDSDYQGRIADLAGYGHVPVTAGCDKVNGATTHVYVRLAATAPRATMTGVDLYYGDGRKIFSQYSVALCSTPTCASALKPVGS